MRAVILDTDRSISLADRPQPKVGPGQVLVKPDFVGICGSDLHAPELDVFARPVVLGHEFAGRIVATGEGVDRWREGDKVTVNPNANVCHACAACRAGRYNLCGAIFENSIGLGRDGGMAEAVALDEVYLRSLPDSLSTQHGAWTEPLAVAVRAVRGANYRLGEPTVVIGAGPIGLLVVQVLRRAGATSIGVIEPTEFRRKKALEVGATEAFAPGAETVAQFTTGEGPSYVFECSGHPTALQTAVSIVAPSGHIRLIGVAGQPTAMNSVDALSKEVTISASFIYDAEFEIAIDLLAAGAIDVDALTSDVLELRQYADAFSRLRGGGTAIKILLEAR